MLKRLRTILFGESDKAPAPTPEAKAVSPELSEEEALPEVSLPTIPGALLLIDGLLQPQWALIDYELGRRYPGANPHRLWHAACLSWVRALAQSLGGSYEVFQSRQFVFVSQRTGVERQHLVNIAENAHQGLKGLFRELVGEGGYGKHVIIVLDDRDYYRYVSHYYSDGTHPQSGGLFLGVGYAHIAVPETRGPYLGATITHELTHNLLAHLKLPPWLNEGLAKVAEQEVAGYRRQWTSERMKEHRDFWNSTNIQDYWSGASFGMVGQIFELSYELSFLLCLEIVEAHREHALDFLKNVQLADAGASAATAFLQTSLGTIAGLYLGDGDWEPVPKPVPESRPDVSYQKRILILELIRAGRLYDAAEFCKEALQRTGGDAERGDFFNYIAAIPLWYDVPQFIPAALRLCEEGMALNPSETRLQIIRAALMMREGSHAESQQVLLDLMPGVKGSSDKAAAYYYLAQDAHYLGNASEAEDYLKMAIELAPNLAIRTEAELLIQGSPDPFAGLESEGT